MKDSYFTLSDRSIHEIRVKGSRFIGLTGPVENRDLAERFISETQKQYYDATHHCYAYRLGFENSLQVRYSDAGEPSGTAGKPIFDVLEGRLLTDVICVVTRYFGGTKLGTGGLLRAYSQCAQETLSISTIIEKFISQTLMITFDYDLTGPVMSLLSRYQCRLLDTGYGNKTVLTIEIRHSQTETFKQELINQTAGKIDLKNA